MEKETGRAESGDGSTFNKSSGSSSTTSSSLLLKLNHVSYVCKSLPKSVQFYMKVLGFGCIRRPSSLKFKGAWLFKDGIGIHLLENEVAPPKQREIDIKDNHISFQCSDMCRIKETLRDMHINFKTNSLKDDNDNIEVEQLFFHDLDGNMIEICNCQNFPISEISSEKALQFSND